MADTPSGETVTPESLSNDGKTTTPALGNVDAAEVERLRKEAEQARMRAQQLQNQLDERRKAEDAAKAKQLEEKEEFRTLYEQTKSRLDEIQETQAAQEHRIHLEKTTDTLLKDYPEAVVEVARTAGLSLAEDNDDAKAELKSKLDSIASKLGTAAKVTPNNPANPAPDMVDRRSLTERNAEGVSPMALAAARGDDSLTRKYIRDLPAIKRMREISRNGY